MSTSLVDINQLSTEEIEEVLRKRRMESNDKKKQYEAKREAFVSHSKTVVESLQQQMKFVKAQMYENLGVFKLAIGEYSNTQVSDGRSLSVVSKDGLTKVVYQTQEGNFLDERADQGAEKLKAFLSKMVKKQSKVAYDMITSILEKKNGNYDPRLVTRLFSYENEYEDEDWREAIRLFKESVQKGGRASYIRVYTRTSVDAKWEAIVLDFASL